MIIDGTAVAAKKLEELRVKIQESVIKPKLAIVNTGDDPATKIYIQKKLEAAKTVGIEVQLVDKISQVDADANGVIVQLPYPNAEETIAKILPEKDVDGLTGMSKFLPATVKGILTILENFDLKNKTFVIVGQGQLVGKPLGDYLEKQNYKVIRCDINTPDLKSETLKGDVLVVATGVPDLIKADMVKPGAVVIDCGSPKAEVDFAKVKEMASAITPVPGGVGPMTVVSLLENTADAANL